MKKGFRVEDGMGKVHRNSPVWVFEELKELRFGFYAWLKMTTFEKSYK